MTVVFQGELELADAKWSLGSGRTVDFWLPGELDLSINPFKVYQKRRGGKVGQRFGAAIVPVGFAIPAYSGEVMLAAWSDNEKGKTVRFWLDEEAGLHPFAGYNKRDAKNSGQRFMAALQVINDDETIADPEREEELQKPRKPRTRSQEVHLIVTGHRFMQYLLHTGADLEERSPKQFVKECLGLQSLSQLDGDDALYGEWTEGIWKPFSTWAQRDEHAHS